MLLNLVGLISGTGTKYTFGVLTEKKLVYSLQMTAEPVVIRSRDTPLNRVLCDWWDFRWSLPWRTFVSEATRTSC
jgi:hypothetical protein